MEALFITSPHPLSGRQAIVEESSSSAWLYLTGPGGARPIADCFLYNLPASGTPDRHSPPPLDPRFASNLQIVLPLSPEEVELVWSETGNAVAARIRGQIVGFIGLDDGRGYSRAVSQDCPW